MSQYRVSSTSASTTSIATSVRAAYNGFTNQWTVNSRKISPLRYFGGKTSAIKQLWPLIPSNTTEIVSPFGGGLSFEFFCAAQGIKVHAYDNDPFNVNFWQCIFDNPTDVAAGARKYLQLTPDQFKHMQKTCASITDNTQRAAVYFTINRSSFSGTMFRGGMSPGHKRFDEDAIDYLANFSCPNISVTQADFSVSLDRHPDALAFLDPPYKIGSNVYGIDGNLQRYFDHERLAAVIKECKSPFILCYENSPERRKQYQDYVLVTPHWKYGASKDKDSKELLILSHHFESRVKELNLDNA